MVFHHREALRGMTHGSISRRVAPQEDHRIPGYWTRAGGFEYPEEHDHPMPTISISTSGGGITAAWPLVN